MTFKVSAFMSTDAGNKKGATPPVQNEGVASEGMPKEGVNMEGKYKSLEKAIETTPQPSYPLIQKVSYMLRNRKNFEKYFEPRLMAIGPIHHNKKPHLQLAEQHKRRLAGLFVKESKRSTDFLYRKIWTEIQDLKKCFDQEAIKSFTNEQLGWILFVDGCAVLQLINCLMHYRLKELKIKTNELTIILCDLFLLENQIPFRVLELLIIWNKNPSQIKIRQLWRKVIPALVELMNPIVRESKKEEEEDMYILDIEVDSINPVHLLDLLRAYLVPNTSPNKEEIDCGWHTIEEIGVDWHTFRNVKELKSAGIYLQRSKTHSLNDISFTSAYFSGKLTLPFINVDHSTGPMFMNLIAYELCPDYHNDFTIISYVCFMDSLIDQAEDVQELRKARILLNFLHSDEEVVQLFNEISIDVVLNPNAYWRVKMEIEDHCKVKWKTWMDEAYHDHFSSPWSLIAFTSVALALLMTAIQTWFAFFPSN